MLQQLIETMGRDVDFTDYFEGELLQMVEEASKGTATPFLTDVLHQYYKYGAFDVRDIIIHHDMLRQCMGAYNPNLNNTPVAMALSTAAKQLAQGDSILLYLETNDKCMLVGHHIKSLLKVTPIVLPIHYFGAQSDMAAAELAHRKHNSDPAMAFESLVSRFIRTIMTPTMTTREFGTEISVDYAHYLIKALKDGINGSIGQAISISDEIAAHHLKVVAGHFKESSRYKDINKRYSPFMENCMSLANSWRRPDLQATIVDVETAMRMIKH